MTPKGKTNIITAASQLFTQQGYDDTSIAEIIKEAKISKGGLYHHFSSKEDILEYLIFTFVDKLESILIESLQTPGSIEEKIILFANIKSLIPQKEQHTYLSLIFSNKDVKIRELFLVRLRKQLVPHLIGLLKRETKLENVDVKAHLVFGITESSIRLPIENLKDQNFMIKFGQEIIDAINFTLKTDIILP